MFSPNRLVALMHFLTPKNLLLVVHRAPQPLQGHHNIFWVSTRTPVQQQSSLLLGASPTQDIQNALNTPGFLCALSTSATVPHATSFSPFKSPSTFCWKNARRDGRHHMSSNHTEAPKTCCRVSRSKNYILTHPVSHKEWK